jgi:hypothetical protein
LRALTLELPDSAIEGIIQALMHGGVSEVEASDMRRITTAITGHVVWWAEHWRELRRR